MKKSRYPVGKIDKLCVIKLISTIVLKYRFKKDNIRRNKRVNINNNTNLTKIKLVTKKEFFENTSKYKMLNGMDFYILWKMIVSYNESHKAYLTELFKSKKIYFPGDKFYEITNHKKEFYITFEDNVLNPETIMYHMRNTNWVENEDYLIAVIER